MPVRHYMLRITTGEDGPADLPPAAERLMGVAEVLETGERMRFASGEELLRLLARDAAPERRAAGRLPDLPDGPAPPPA